MEAIELVFDNQIDDHYYALKLFYKYSIWSKTDKIVGVILIMVGLLSSFFEGIFWWTVIWIPIGVIEITNIVSIKWLKAYFFFKVNPKFRETYTLVFSEKDIHFKTKSIDSHLEWSYYNAWFEDEKVILLSYGPEMYTVIPKRVINDEIRLKQLKTLIKSKIPKM